MVFKIFTDGASKGNPGKSGAGAVLFDCENVIDEVSVFLGIKTNNEAEYLAVILGLEKAKQHKIKKINLYSDSQLLVKQLNGLYKVKSENIKPLFKKVLHILKDFECVKFIWIEREKNSYADKLANNCIT